MQFPASNGPAASSRRPVKVRFRPRSGEIHIGAGMAFRIGAYVVHSTTSGLASARQGRADANARRRLLGQSRRHARGPIAHGRGHGRSGGDLTGHLARRPRNFMSRRMTRRTSRPQTAARDLLAAAPPPTESLRGGESDVFQR